MLAGCTTAVAGRPQLPAKESQPLTSAEAFGDLATADYCGLLEDVVHALPSEMGGIVSPPVNGITHCEFSVQRDVRTSWVVVGYIWATEQGDADAGRVVRRQVKVVPGREDDDECAREVHFPDRVAIEVIVGGDKPKKTGPGRCDLAEAVANVVVAKVAEGPVRRLDELDAATLVEKDTCELVPARVVRRAGLALGRVETVPDGHVCLWYDRSDRLVGVAQIGLSGIHPEEGGGQLATVAGRESVVRRSQRGGCTVSAQYANFPAHLNSWEELSVAVFRTADGDPCAVAKRVARSVWPKLPELE